MSPSYRRWAAAAVVAASTCVVLLGGACDGPAPGGEWESRCPSGMPPDNTGCHECYANVGDPCTPSAQSCVLRTDAACRAEVACGVSATWELTFAGSVCCRDTPGCAIESLDAHFSDDHALASDVVLDVPSDGEAGDAATDADGAD